MFRNSRPLILIFIIMLGIFIIGTIRLLVLRFETGDVYPEYSSLRSDPLGTKILFESMKMTVPLTVDRNYRPMYRLPAGHNITLFSLGTRAHTLTSVQRDTFRALSRFLTSGGRVVISFFPVRGSSPKKDGGETGAVGEEEKEHRPSRKRGDIVPLTTRWGIELGNAGAGHDEPSAALTSDEGKGRLPGTISCHTTLTFDIHHDAWKVIYSRGKHPVLIERQMGKGSLVLCADSYLFSNEAMLKDRHPELLTWFMGENHHMLFDESHLGIQKSEGIVSLARKYNLHHSFVILLILAVLFIWRKAAPFVPPSDKDGGEKPRWIRTKRDHTEGLVSLLRRYIPKRDILRSCRDEWERGLAPGQERLKGKIEKIARVVDGDSLHGPKGDPVKGYRAICKILSERN